MQIPTQVAVMFYVNGPPLQQMGRCAYWQACFPKTREVLVEELAWEEWPLYVGAFIFAWEPC